MNRLSKLLIISFLILSVFQLKAVPAYPYPIKVQQPDGSYITVINRGDEFFHFQTTEDGFPIVKDAMGIYRYAKIEESGRLIDMKLKATDKIHRTADEIKFIQNLKDETVIQKINIQQKAKRVFSSNIAKPSKFPINGSPRSLVILVNFSDKSFVVNTPQTAYTNLLNQDGYSANSGTGSAKDYFRDNSMGSFIPQFDVVGPFNLTKSLSTYGKNDSDGDDQDPVQMVVDACTLASQNGVDFSKYDTDNDGYVDNVFIYYAGYNEAENGPDDTVWPHRWGVYPGYNYTGSSASITFNGKKISDYACTSELRGSSGSNMCCIGTFCHEFGHVLGLVDFYATNNATHQTLSYWDVMDAGPYLNSGRTPPSYSAHERFYLGWLTPTELKLPEDATLEPLSTSNKAYLISESGNHNLIGNNPSPAEHFLLENRQNTGWDKYLPGHGMFITRVNYNGATWNSNTPNNDPNAMGVDIVEADGIASNQTLAGDPFPGTSARTSYTPILRSGTVIQKPITFIKETSGIITFRFKGGKNAPAITTASTFSQFNTVQGTPSATQTITVSGKKLLGDLNISFGTGTHFQIKKATDAETAWGKVITLTQVDSVVTATDIMVRYNPTIPSYTSTHGDLLNIFSTDAENVKVNLTGKSSRPIYIKTPVANNAKNITYKNFVANWNTVMDGDKPAAGYYLTVYRIESNLDTTYLEKNKWLTITSDTLNNLVSDYDYEYYVVASDKNTIYRYENLAGPSNTIKVRTLAYTSDKVLRVTVDQENGNILVFVPKVGSTVNVYNTLGKKIMSFVAESDIVNLNFLPKNHVYIIQSEKLRTKIIW